MSLQISARTVDAAEFFGCCETCGIQACCAHLIDRGVEKILEDGRAALSLREVVPAEAVADLENCVCCTMVEAETEPHYVDGDEWSKLADGNMFGALKPSVDLVLFVKDAGGALRACLAEAKLGSVLPQSGQVRRPTRTELFEKLDYSCRRLANRIDVCEEAFLIASKSTEDEQRSRAFRWNQEQSFPLKVKCLCLRDFLETVDVQLRHERVCGRKDSLSDGCLCCAS